jgi:hypothetical protein
LYLDSFFIFNLKEIVKLFVKLILQLFVHINTLCTKQKILFFCLSLMENAVDDLTVVCALGFEDGLESRNKIRIYFPSGESLLTDLDGLKYS